MHWSIPNFNIPAGNPQEFELLMIGSFKFPPPLGQNCIQIPYPSARFNGKCLSCGCLNNKKKKKNLH